MNKIAYTQTSFTDEIWVQSPDFETMMDGDHTEQCVKLQGYNRTLHFSLKDLFGGNVGYLATRLDVVQKAAVKAFKLDVMKSLGLPCWEVEAGKFDEFDEENDGYNVKFSDVYTSLQEAREDIIYQQLNKYPFCRLRCGDIVIKLSTMLR